MFGLQLNLALAPVGLLTSNGFPKVEKLSGAISAHTSLAAAQGEVSVSCIAAGGCVERIGARNLATVMGQGSFNGWLAVLLQFCCFWFLERGLEFRVFPDEKPSMFRPFWCQKKGIIRSARFCGKVRLPVPRSGWLQRHQTRRRLSHFGQRIVHSLLFMMKRVFPILVGPLSSLPTSQRIAVAGGGLALLLLINRKNKKNRP